MMPTATHEVGSRRGFYLGHTLVGVRAAGALQPARGLRQRPQHDDPQRRRARLGQDDARPEAQVRGVPAGRARDRLRPQGRSPLPPARAGRAPRRDRSRCAPTPRCAGCSTRCASRPSTCARTPPCRSCATCCRRAPSRPGRRRSSAPSIACSAARASRPASRSCARCARATRSTRQVAKTLAVYARSGLTQLGFADPDVTPAAGRAPPGHLPADPRPARPRAGDAALGVLAGRARRGADRAADRDVRDAPDGRRARAAEAVQLRRGLAAARRPGRPHAAGLAAADGPLGAGGADHLHAAGHRHAARGSASRWRT